MEKEQVKKFDLEAAFKALDEIEIPVAEKGIKANRVNFKEALSQKPAHEVLIEDYFNIGDSEALEEAADEREEEVAQAKLDRIEKIVDLDADSPEDLLPSYVGKYIIQCPQCMTLFYKNKEDIDYSEENPDVVNINEVCQHCGNTSGYTLIGKVDGVDNEPAESNLELPAEENELDLDFDTEAAEGEEAPAAEENSEENLDNLDLNLEDIPEEEEEKNESLNLSKEAPSDFETEHKSENLTLNEGWKEAGYTSEEICNKAIEDGIKEHGGREGFIEFIKTYRPKVVEQEDDERKQKEADALIELVKNYKVEESLNNSEALKDAEEGSELKTENESENLTLNEEVDKDLDKKLDAHNDYIAYLKDSINAKEEALKNEKNEEIKVLIQNELITLQNSLEAALPDALKADVVADNAETIEAPVEAEAPVDEVPAEEVADEVPAEEPVDEQLTEEVPAEEPKAEGNEVDYVEYKHSYCHVLEPMLKRVNYLCNVLDDEKADLEKCKNVVLKYLKDSPELKITRKEQEFFDNVKAQESKRDLYNYIKNAINKAREIKVKVDDNGELVEGLNEGFEPVEESLNKSEAAPSEHETENGSENLTLNESLVEDANSEIDNIIRSWGEVKEDLNEASDAGLDAVLDSPEFQEPVSEAEINAIISDWKDDVEEGYTGNPAERTTHLEYTDDDPTDGKAVLPDNIEKQLTEEANAEGGKFAIEMPLKNGEKAYRYFNTKEEAEAWKKTVGVNLKVIEVNESLTEADEEAEVEVEETEEEAPVEEPTEVQAEEEPKEDEEKEELPDVEFNTEEVKEVAAEVVEKVEEADLPKDEEEKEEAVAEVVNEVVDEKVEEKVEEANETEEAETEVEETEVVEGEPEISEEPANDLVFDEDSVDDLDECSLNKHIDEYLQEVYSNVKCFEATDCRLHEGKLIVEGKISFNSGKEKLTMFEFLPNYCEGKLFFEGYNKDFSSDKAFTLNCSINESKTLITESFGYKYAIGENLVEGLK